MNTSSISQEGQIDGSRALDRLCEKISDEFKDRLVTAKGQKTSDKFVPATPSPIMGWKDVPRKIWASPITTGKEISSGMQAVRGGGGTASFRIYSNGNSVLG